MKIASHGSDTDGHSWSFNTATTSSSYDYIDQDEISEAKEKTPPRKNQSTAQTSRSTKDKPAITTPDTSKTPAVGPTSPTAVNRCIPDAGVKSKRSYVWNRVKQVKEIIVRSASQ